MTSQSPHLMLVHNVLRRFPLKRTGWSGLQTQPSGWAKSPLMRRFVDSDRDGVPDHLDCRPYDWRFQDRPKVDPEVRRQNVRDYELIRRARLRGQAATIEELRAQADALKAKRNQPASGDFYSHPVPPERRAFLFGVPKRKPSNVSQG